MTSVQPSLRLARAAAARRLFSSTSAARWGNPRPSLAGLPIDVHPEVQAAQAEGRAIVALESTLITHGTLLPPHRCPTASFASRRANRPALRLAGLPPPHSNTLPVECEDILRAQGVTPATIAILNGRIKVGLNGSQLDELAEKGFAAKKDGGAKLWKVGRRELGAAVVKVSSCDHGESFELTART
jgi:pseudouridylate synthase / pseudouridine kinase